jgi:hypothetical protein
MGDPPGTPGVVSGGSFGSSGNDYYGDMRRSTSDPWLRQAPTPRMLDRHLSRPQKLKPRTWMNNPPRPELGG